MVVTCEIEFDNNPSGTYFAGQVLTGKVTLRSDKAKQVKGVLLKINGYGHTSWSESESRSSTDVHGNTTSSTTTTDYSGQEEYIASLTYLVGTTESQSCIIEAGIHTFTFSCHLPTTCPSSFEGCYGHIRYTVKVVLTRPWKFDQTFTKGFTVLKLMDLNNDSPLLRVPADSEAQKIFCCGPCRSSPMTIRVDLPISGFVPGQIIPVQVLVTNDSNIPVERLDASLVMLVCYYSQFPCSATKGERILVAKFKGDPVPHHCKKLYNYSLMVPATPPTCFNLSKIIQLAYQIEVEANIKGCHPNQVVCLPVTIGDVPFFDVIQQQPLNNNTMQRSLMNAAMGVYEANASDSGSTINVNTEPENSNAIRTLPSPFLDNANIPPPNYETAVHMKVGQINANEPHDYGEKEFRPQYPVFNLPSPPPIPENEIGGGFVNNTVEVEKGTWL